MNLQDIVNLKRILLTFAGMISVILLLASCSEPPAPTPTVETIVPTAISAEATLPAAATASSNESRAVATAVSPPPTSPTNSHPCPKRLIIR